MFYRNNMRFCRQSNNCITMPYNENDMEKICNYNSPCYCNEDDMMENCSCGFESEWNPFPTNPMLGQSYVPIQTMGKTFRPEIGLKNGTIFPELVSPYCPNQSIEENEYIRATNKIGEGCNG